MESIWKIALATVVIFGAGVGTGGLLVSHVDRTRVFPPRRPPDHAPPLWPSARGVLQGGQPEVDQRLAIRRTEFLLAISRQLNLSSTQTTNIGKIVHEGQESTKAIWSRVTPEMIQEMDNVTAKVRAELSPGQCARFDELLKQGPRRRPDEEGSTNRRFGDRPSGRGSGPAWNPRSMGRSNGPPQESQ